MKLFLFKLIDFDKLFSNNILSLNRISSRALRTDEIINFILPPTELKNVAIYNTRKLHSLIKSDDSFCP